MRVEPDEREPVVPRGEPFDGADVGATAAAEDERSLRKLRRERERLLPERRLLDHARLGVRQRQRGGLDHRVAAVAPGARHPDEARAEDAPAGVALVLGPERDGRERAAVGALCTEAAHASSFS